MSPSSLVVCYFGTYSPKHTRNLVNLRGLRENGVTVIECRSDKRGIKKYIDLYRQHRRIRGAYDAMIVGFNGHVLVPLAWYLTRRPRTVLIFDAFTSLYDSIIDDRRSYSKLSVHAGVYWILDWIAFHLADFSLMDSEAHARYVEHTFNVSKNRIGYVPVGCPDDVMYPRPEHPHDDFRIHFHGTNIPTQGIEYIIDAAEILKNENVSFTLVGRLASYQRTVEERGLRNVHFTGYVSYDRLAQTIADADLCLGAFGATRRATRTGAFKIVEALAMKKPTLAGDSPALREFFNDRTHIVYCQLANATDLAEKILMLKNDTHLRNHIAALGHELYVSRFTPKSIGETLIQSIIALLRERKLHIHSSA